MDTPVNKEERSWALGAHLSAFAGHFFPLGHVLAPLILWQWKKETMPFFADQAKESLNFQLTVTLGFAVCALLAFTIVGIVVAVPLAIAIYVADIVLVIIAALKANDGTRYRYPWTLRIVE